MKHYFLGMAVEYSGGEWFKHLFTLGRRRDYNDLKNLLEKKYEGKAMLCKNGRSALTLALKAYFEPGDEILVNGFTCYAVYEAIKAAKLVPVFVDISKEDLNFNVDTLGASMGINTSRPCATNGERIERSSARNDGPERASREGLNPHNRIRGIIIQNTLGNPVDITEIEEFAKENGLIIIEDLAHCAGVRYPDGQEVGTVGAATVLSFGKDKSIDTVSGGAVILRRPYKDGIKAPSKVPKLSDHLRARFYPMFGAMCRGLSYVGLGGALMRLLVKIHFVEKSADNKLDITRRMSKFEARRALKKIKDLRRTGEPVLREFYLVRDRDEVLKKLQKKGYYFGGLWYEKPVSPKRYYKKVHFPEKECPNAVYVSEHIINIPTYYTRRDLTKARNIIKEYREEENE